MSLLSEIQVINSALADIGQSDIASIRPPDGSETAAIAALKYDATRDEVLRQAWWGFARKFAVLVGGDAPAFGFTNGFALPSDYIRIIRTEGNENFQLFNNSAGQVAFASDSSEVKIEYIARIKNTIEWDDLFTQSVIKKLAATFAVAINHNRKLAESILVEYQTMLDDARAINGHDDNNPKFIESNVLVEARGRGQRRPDKVWNVGW